MFFENFAEITPVLKGWSEDKKYCVTGYDGTKYLLRISPTERFETRKNLFEMLGKVAALGVPMCKPIDFGTCSDGVYALYSWIDGEDLRDLLPKLPEVEQYKLGLKSGEILRVIHSIPAPDNQENWAERFNRKADIKIKQYQACGFKINGDDNMIKYVEQNRHLLENRPQCFQHGDYHDGNMMIENGELIIIDFDRYDYGDPFEEYNRIAFSAQSSPHFATGQLNGYFGGDVPLEFFKLLAFYIAPNALASVYWALNFGEKETDFMIKLTSDTLKCYNNFENVNNLVPSWYLKNYK